MQTGNSHDKIRRTVKKNQQGYHAETSGRKESVYLGKYQSIHEKNTQERERRRREIQLQNRLREQREEWWDHDGMLLNRPENSGSERMSPRGVSGKKGRWNS